jgi:maltooligosyltrehalose trehalohydrolase
LSESPAVATRRLPIGAEPQPDGGAHFRVWAPARRRVSVVMAESGSSGTPVGSGLSRTLHAENGGYFSGLVADARPGDLYWFRLDHDERLYPDPASRFQPQGPHGPSMIVDPLSFAWTDQAWAGVGLKGQVLYELHVGTYTPEGTWDTLSRELAEIRRAGITVIEVMPVADFSGRFGWGYDGVNLFAPTRLYGAPDDFRRFVDRAHAAGLAVILDVVYNHLGPDGNYLTQFSPDYFTQKYANDWGAAINFDGERSGPVREFFVANAGYWIEEFHLDGLRLDATQSIHDASATHILTEVGRRVRDAARGRATIIVAENEPQHSQLVRPVDRGGYGLDGLWNDDFHHSAVVALTGRREAYYTDYFGAPQEFLSMIKRGFLYQGQRYSWQKQPRGRPAGGVGRAAFVTFIENHDQVANSAHGKRLHQLASPGAYRAMTGLWLLGPNTPMLFQGQEFGSSAPFLYFADPGHELADAVREGRRAFLAQFASLAAPEMQALIAAPSDPRTFARCKLNLSERATHAAAYTLHRDLLELRRTDPVFGSPDLEVDGAVFGPSAFVLRFFGGAHGDRLLLVNLGADLRLTIVPQPLLAAPEDACWTVVWSSEDPRYGGGGTPPVETGERWIFPGQATVALKEAKR